MNLTTLRIKHPTKKHTKKHRPAIWEGILGTVYAMNDDGQVEYFDYDVKKAVTFAGITDTRDPRWSRYDGSHGRTEYYQTRPGIKRWVLWITKSNHIDVAHRMQAEQDDRMID